MKPRIQELFDAFQKFGVSVSMSYTYASWLEARFELRRDLDRLGIADQFDWSLERD